MRIEQTLLEGVYVIVPDPVADDRGFFARIFCRDRFGAAGLHTDFPQWSVSVNLRKATLRGLHWQAPPLEEIKIVRCTRGAIFDVAVDISPGSAGFKRWVGVELSADNCRSLYIPKGFAHGFQTLTDDVEVVYHISERFEPGLSRGVRWNDPAIGVRWPEATDRIISDRDKSLPFMNDA